MDRAPEQRLVTIINPSSTRAQQASKNLLAHLEDSHWNKALEPVETQNIGYEGNVDLIAGRLKPNDRVIALGGDGTVNLAANGIIQSGASDIDLIPFPGGNANDIAFSIYGRRIRKPSYVLDLLDHGDGRSFNGIRVERTGFESRHALGYVGIGATAAVSERFSDPLYRKSKQKTWMPTWLQTMYSDMVDGPNMLKDFWNNQVFTYSENDRQATAHEMSFVNIRLMSKRMKMNVDTLSSEVMELEFGPEHFFRRLVRRMVCEGLTTGFTGPRIAHREVAILTPSMIQFDGEAEKIEAGTSVRVAPNPNAVRVLLPRSSQ